jgi:uncharacterized alpha-E superfamily protein
MEYGPGGGPAEITEFLTLNKRMPRSLAFCVDKLRSNLRYLHRGVEGQLPSLAMVDHLERQYLSHDIAAVFERGLHQFIEEILDQLGRIARQIEIDFRFFQ